ncbi:TPA: hypothetical protein PFP98_002395, partial [Staphylococcus pseudintermedius]|nr:hypothetical protein [Staphylococcus pseudintermedius]
MKKQLIALMGTVVLLSGCGNSEKEKLQNEIKSLEDEQKELKEENKKLKDQSEKL